MLLNNGANVNHANSDGDTALILAAVNNKSDIVQVLLNNGANVNHANSDGDTALMSATQRRNIDIVQLLLNNGANVDHANIHGDTALIKGPSSLFAKNKLEEGEDQSEEENKVLYIMQLLLNTGQIDINHTASDGFSALMVSAHGGHENIVRLLLYYGANVNYDDNYFGNSALEIAAEKGYNDIVELLLFVPEMDVNGQNIQNMTALALAAEKGYNYIVDQLMKTERIKLWNATKAINKAIDKGHQETAELIQSYLY